VLVRRNFQNVLGLLEEEAHKRAYRTAFPDLAEKVGAGFSLPDFSVL
jgi:hypothetical protein